MLWAALFLIGLYFLTGGSNVFLGEWLIKDSKNRFEEVIQEKERSQKAMGILDEMIRDAKDFNQEAEKAEKKLEKLVKDYRSTRGDFNQLFSEIQEKGERTIAKILDRLPDLKSNILREEWPKAFEERK